VANLRLSGTLHMCLEVRDSTCAVGPCRPFGQQRPTLDFGKSLFVMNKSVRAENAMSECHSEDTRAVVSNLSLNHRAFEV